MSRKVGYSPNGTQLQLRDDSAAKHHKFILDPDKFVRPTEPVVTTGAAALRCFLGVPRESDATNSPGDTLTDPQPPVSCCRKD